MFEQITVFITLLGLLAFGLWPHQSSLISNDCPKIVVEVIEAEGCCDAKLAKPVEFKARLDGTGAASN